MRYRAEKPNYMRSFFLFFTFITFLLIFTGCEKSHSIVSNVSEREANIILVLLESKGIQAQKTKSTSGTEMGGSGELKYSILVLEHQAIEAIAYLNQNGFPRQSGTNLLDLFAKQGLMTSDKEETIRYQAGLAQQLTNTILMIDGVIDASVQLSFPPDETGIGGTQEEEKKITAAVYVKHQGVIDDPNIHLENKIKRLISGSVTGLNINDVTVVSDRSRFTDISLGISPIALSGQRNEYVSIWNIIMSKESAMRFRFLFFLITTVAVVLALVLGWLVWKCYPILKKGGVLKTLFKSPLPWSSARKNEETLPEENPPNEG